MLDDDLLRLLPREVLRERVAGLVAESCAWAVGLSDSPHHVRRHGRSVASGLTLGLRAESGLHLGDDDGRLELGDARPGSFQDALNALTPDGRLHADRFEDDVLVPFVLQTCLAAAERAREQHPGPWTELLDDLGDDGSDLTEVIRTAEWETPLRIEAEHLALAALADVPLVEVEAEGLPLSLVRAAEAVTRQAAPAAGPATRVPDDDLAGALFLAEAALQEAALTVPVPPAQAPALLGVLAAEGIEPEEVLVLLPHLPVQQDTADDVARLLAERDLR